MKQMRQTVTCPETGKVYPIPAGGSTDTPPPPTTEAPPADPPAAPGDPKPPWGSDDDFNAEKAWSLIQNLRGDVDTLKPQAAELRQLKEADKTESQKAADRAAEAEERADKAEAQAARLNAAVKHGLSEDDLELLEGVPADKIEERAAKLAQRLAVSSDNKPGPHVPREGVTNPPPKADEMRQFTRNLFGRGE